MIIKITTKTKAKTTTFEVFHNLNQPKIFQGLLLQPVVIVIVVIII